MSHLTPCNHCSLRWLKRDAEAEGRVITTLPGTEMIGETYGVDAFEHASGEEPSEANWVAWFMAVGDQCECDAPDGDVSDEELLHWAATDPDLQRELLAVTALEPDAAAADDDN